MTTVLLGTTKGVFLLRRDAEGWAVDGPHCDGWPINHVIGTGERIWAAGGGAWTGAGVWRSADGGRSWTLVLFGSGEFEAFARANPEMLTQFGMTMPPPALFDDGLVNLWSLARAGSRLFAGAKPAALYVSEDDGETWAPVPGLNAHPSRGEWAPGGAGLTLHTILVDRDAPARLWVGISSAGVLASEDGGASWERRNRRSNAAPSGPFGDGTEIGHCVHNMALGARPGLLYMQNHHGVFRSRDGGRSWDEISAGLPSTFGFPIGADPLDADTVWVLPLNGDVQGRFPPDASAAVWKSADGGRSWQRKSAGLPEKGCYFTVLRQAMAVERGSPARVWFGTNSGSVFRSGDAGESWEEVARHLPTVLSVELLEAA